MKNSPTITDKCGTHTGVSRHLSANEEYCPACWEAKKSYQRWYVKARNAALKRLKDAHLTEYYQYLEEEQSELPMP
jgi:hypothetical protein